MGGWQGNEGVWGVFPAYLCQHDHRNTTCLGIIPNQIQRNEGRGLGLEWGHVEAFTSKFLGINPPPPHHLIVSHTGKNHTTARIISQQHFATLTQIANSKLHPK